MKHKPTLANMVRLDKNGMALASDVEDAMIQRQANSAAITAQANDPRLKAQSVIDEVVKTAAACKVAADVLRREIKNLSDTADASKASVFATADKLNTAMARLWGTLDLERLEKVTLLIERLEKSITTLNDLEKNGKLEAICKAIR